MRVFCLLLILTSIQYNQALSQNKVRVMIQLKPGFKLESNRKYDNGLIGIKAIDRISTLYKINSVSKVYSGVNSLRQILLLQFDEGINSYELLEQYKVLEEV